MSEPPAVAGAIPVRTRRKIVGRISRYGPLLLWMVLIFFASTSAFSASNTGSFIRPALVWLFPSISEAEIEFLHFLIRKAAHFSEYAILALLASRAFLRSSHGVLRRAWFQTALILTFLYSLSDEFHQSFVPSRTASIYDSLLDTTGGLAALLFIALWRICRRPAAKQ